MPVSFPVPLLVLPRAVYGNFTTRTPLYRVRPPTYSACRTFGEAGWHCGVCNGTVCVGCAAVFSAEEVPPRGERLSLADAPDERCRPRRRVGAVGLPDVLPARAAAGVQRTEVVIHHRDHEIAELRRVELGPQAACADVEPHRRRVREMAEYQKLPHGHNLRSFFAPPIRRE